MRIIKNIIFVFGIWGTVIFGGSASSMCNKELEFKSNVATQTQLSQTSKQIITDAALDYRRDYGEHTQGLTADITSIESTPSENIMIATIQFLRNSKPEGWTMQVSYEVLDDKVILKTIRYRGAIELQNWVAPSPAQ